MNPDLLQLVVYGLVAVGGYAFRVFHAGTTPAPAAPSATPLGSILHQKVMETGEALAHKLLDGLAGQVFAPPAPAALGGVVLTPLASAPAAPPAK